MSPSRIAWRALWFSGSNRVNADCDNDGEDNRCFYNVNPHCALRESQNSISCRHDFTQ
jgi:hypothetical protein